MTQPATFIFECSSSTYLGCVEKNSSVRTNRGRWKSRPVTTACCITTKSAGCWDCGRRLATAARTLCRRSGAESFRIRSK